MVATAAGDSAAAGGDFAAVAVDLGAADREVASAVVDFAAEDGAVVAGVAVMAADGVGVAPAGDGAVIPATMAGVATLTGAVTADGVGVGVGGRLSLSALCLGWLPVLL
ncbi:hypothetical protein AOE01nite_29760 [Acetobacter oeni]|uniref:Uncharacterized protein n=1 Tax=Acetobacter oeni TaxID=304077 RepID=A0A511XP55_9PROT|nr:hypothetical protein AOE01nite_29760 [Acetobacter oeni]